VAGPQLAGPELEVFFYVILLNFVLILFVNISASGFWITCLNVVNNVPLCVSNVPQCCGLQCLSVVDKVPQCCG
jgi:hypothetical protein